LLDACARGIDVRVWDGNRVRNWKTWPILGAAGYIRLDVPPDEYVSY
jgi:hypothetical protein